MNNTNYAPNEAMSRQEAFDIVVKRMHAQGWNRSKTHGGAGVCAYRGSNGMACAAGALIKDEHYYKTLEGMSLDGSMSVRQALMNSGVAMNDIDFVGDMQCAHDSSCTPESMRMKFENLARKFKLTFPELPDTQPECSQKTNT